MTLTYTEPHAPAPAPTTEDAYVPVYARKPPKKKAPPWLMAAPVALVAVGAVAWIAMSSPAPEPAAAEQTAELTAAPLAETPVAPLADTAPLAPVRPAALAEPVAATPVRPTPARTTSARPAPRAAPATAAAATVEAEPVVPAGPQPYLAEAQSAPPATETSVAAPEPVLITPLPLD